MYDTVKIAQTIKETAKSKNIVLKNMLEECGMNKNAISTMISRGSVPQADNLAKIADYLDVSVDYLLGRIDSPNGYNNNQIHNSDNVALGENAQVNVNAAVKSYDEMTAELIKRFRSLSFDEKIEVFNYIKNIK